MLESAPMELTDRHLQEAFPGATDFGARIQADERCTIERTLDVIGGKWLTEINVTSPTGIVAIDKFNGTDTPGLIWDAIEARLEARRSS